ncbi:UDP-glucose 4-epimerase [Thermosipho africanus H17ap60334]|jgi:UDP-glucose 4-epimerase|uniref:UDP-glucose 4-epimerase n=1 Tax=Thermosipho africanus (strain TCF52B) TaxID=484019 RepID=B7IGH2_THEAB|nr:MULTISPECIES: UDP-glucose 4-epimerase GalE [Thermosipho]ACJ75186.1 UDP-glucose 4-epimerase [Thermosipho africanus TCF52B]EKF48491.1 UDP-glucose 4-epimerase [Thermosipho africanus H17ap60334]MBZ4650388.1 galE [Thermosipho sp. (in: thermotogales)]MDK2899550.1 UDP-glucose 4-epimerase [Thermosipho sp. (in: thermotogales)]RDI90377.1 UDP-glucose 4-epimerase [Thermosipho africanus Ob7]
MTVLVAGGAGYIGSHVCKMLRERGYDVVVIDNLSHGYKSFTRYGEFVLGDISDENLLDLVFKTYKIDAVMHFCAYIEVGESVVDPNKYYQNNVSNTLTLLNSMLKHDVKYFIFSSTAAVYGMPQRIPIKEDDPKMPINPYGKSKYMVEQILDDFDRAYGLKSIRFRYFNAAGADESLEIGEAHEPETHLIPLILDAALSVRDSIKIFGTDYETKDGTCIRDFVHVNDLADAHIKGLEYLISEKKTDYFNLGSGSGFSVREVIEKVKEVTNVDFKVEEVDRRPGDPAYLIADNTKARKILGWEPKYDLEKIIQTAWNWHKVLRKK